MQKNRKKDRQAEIFKWSWTEEKKLQNSKRSNATVPQILKNTQNKGYIKSICELFSFLFVFQFRQTFLTSSMLIIPTFCGSVHSAPLPVSLLAHFLLPVLKFMHFLHPCQRVPLDTHTNSTKTANPLAMLARSQNVQACERTHTHRPQTYPVMAQSTPPPVSHSLELRWDTR